jgi:uncharacterized protein YndB with AHSA1/START domain
MDHDAVLAHPIQLVFGHLADPARLSDWLPAATAIDPGHGAATFTLQLSGDPAYTAAGELIGYEPPWQLAYRLVAGPHTHVLRITCTTVSAGTRVHIRQAGPAAPLTVDLARLNQALTARPQPSTPGPDRDNNPIPLTPAASPDSRQTTPKEPHTTASRGRPGDSRMTAEHVRHHCRYRPCSGSTPRIQPRMRRDIMHPIFKELFLDTDDLAAEDDRRHRARRSRRVRPAMITRPAAAHRANRPRP